MLNPETEVCGSRTNRYFNSRCVICQKTIWYEPFCKVTPTRKYGGKTIVFHRDCLLKENKEIKEMNSRESERRSNSISI